MYKINRYVGNDGCSYTSVTLSNGQCIDLYISDNIHDDFLTDSQVHDKLVDMGCEEVNNVQGE